MKKIILTFILMLAVFGCSSGSGNEEITLVDQVTDSEQIFTIEDFKQIGFKQSKKYKVEDLPGATSAFYGFIKNKLDPKDDKIDFEIRFYANHADAVQMGTEPVVNATGVDACVDKYCALWKEDLKQRVMLAELGVASFHAGSGKVIPKYYNYVIYGNMIIMCPGWTEEDAMERCSKTVFELVPSLLLPTE
jgi:hypothetical protein